MKLCRKEKTRRRKELKWKTVESFRLTRPERHNKIPKTIISRTTNRLITNTSVSSLNHTRHTTKSTTPENNRNNPPFSSSEHNKTLTYTISNPNRKSSHHMNTPFRPTTATRATPSTPSHTTQSGTADAKNTSRIRR